MPLTNTTKVLSFIIGGISLLAAVVTIRSDTGLQDLACKMGLSSSCKESQAAALSAEEICAANLPERSLLPGGALSEVWIPDPKQTFYACLKAGRDENTLPMASAASAAGEHGTAKSILWSVVNGRNELNAAEALANLASRYWYTSAYGDERHRIAMKYTIASAAAGYVPAQYMLSSWLLDGTCLSQKQLTLDNSAIQAIANLGSPSKGLQKVTDLKLPEPGECLPPNRELAVFLLRETIESGYIPAKVRAAYWMREGFTSAEALGLSVSQEKFAKDLLADLKSKANQEGLRARYHYAWALKYGHGTQPSPKLALEQYLLLSKAGLPRAQEQVACMYDKERTDCAGIAPDREIAQRHYRLAADGDNEQAHNALGYQYCVGDAVEVDTTKCIAHLTTGARLGSSGAAMNLGAYYMKRTPLGNSNFEPVNPQKAFQWYTVAGHLGKECGYLRAAQALPDHPMSDTFLSFVNGYHSEKC